jgi:hypothetical protein
MNSKSRRASRRAVAGHGRDLVSNYATHREIAPALKAVSGPSLAHGSRPIGEPPQSGGNAMSVGTFAAPSKFF